METVNIHEAKTNLSRLLSRVEQGEEIVIANRGVPVARLVPFQTRRDGLRPAYALRAASNGHHRASLGQDRGQFTVPDDFKAPLPEHILAAFEGDAE